MGLPPNSSRNFRAVVIVCRIVLGALFILAAVGKILDPSTFAKSVAAFRILPFAWVNIFAIILPWIELLSGLSLLTGVLMSAGAVIVAGLNMVFIVAAASAMARGLSIECGCFTLSHSHDKVGWMLIARDTGLLLLCIPVLIASLRNPQSEIRNPKSETA